MNLEEWGSLQAFESIIPCTTPTWSLHCNDDGTPYLMRVLAWKVKQQPEPEKAFRGFDEEVVNIYASMTGLVARDGEEPSEVVDWGEISYVNDFVCYLDESEKGEAQARAAEWLADKPEREARKAKIAERQAAKAAEEPRA